MAKIRTKRLRFHRVRSYEPSAPIMGLKANSSNPIVRQHAIDVYNAQYADYTKRVKLHRADVAYSVFVNTSFGVKLVFRVVAVVLAIGLLFVLWNKQFDFTVIGPAIVGSNYAPFNFQEFLTAIDSSLPDTPAASALEGFVILNMSIVYVIGFAFKLLGGLLAM